MHRTAPTSTLSPLSTIGRHAHAHPYATLVLSGGYEEAGDGGRFCVEAGDVLLHPPFSAHCDRSIKAATRLLDLPLPFDGRDWSKRGRVADPDRIVRTAECDLPAATALLLEQFEAMTLPPGSLADQLALELDNPEPPPLSIWARQHGLARETVTRQFARLYEVAPARYRVEARARRAWRQLLSRPSEPFSIIALDCGYADQAQMSREIRALTGRPPGSWRKATASASHSFKTGMPSHS